jgi:hypothetical protein
MNAIRIHKRVDSETLHLPELKSLIGKTVEIIVLEGPPVRAATEEDWQAFFASAGTDLVDPELYKQYREFDRQHNLPPEL